MILYLVGISVALYLRPALMFNKDGTWKEFGVGNIEATVFPFWLFCIVWAVVAYIVCRLFFSEAAESTNDLVYPINSNEPALETKPGYYKLNANIMKKKGVPRYIYVGPDTPDDLEA